MNVASLELSKELYELSGWEPDNWYAGGTPQDVSNVSQFFIDEQFKNGLIEPAYSLGYLLRKLPAVYEEKGGVKWILKLEIFDNIWDCYYVASAKPITLADTPEDAACKLAIELFKQGVL